MILHSAKTNTYKLQQTTSPWIDIFRYAEPWCMFNLSTALTVQDTAPVLLILSTEVRPKFFWHYQNGYNLFFWISFRSVKLVKQISENMMVPIFSEVLKISPQKNGKRERKKLIFAKI